MRVKSPLDPPQPFALTALGGDAGAVSANLASNLATVVVVGKDLSLSNGFSAVVTLAASAGNRPPPIGRQGVQAVLQCGFSGQPMDCHLLPRGEV